MDWNANPQDLDRNAQPGASIQKIPRSTITAHEAFRLTHDGIALRLYLLTVGKRPSGMDLDRSTTTATTSQEIAVLGDLIYSDRSVEGTRFVHSRVSA